MNPYLQDTEYAARALFDAITHETDVLADLLKQRASVRAKEQAYDLAFQARINHPAANYWYGEWFKAAQERNEVEKQVAELELRIADREFSVETLAAAVLQIAKQGISTVHGRPDNCPKTREVFGQDVARVIFEARNQALHYEEPKMVAEKCVQLFTALAEAGADQGLREARDGKNLAGLVLRVLEWKDYDSYTKDMIAIVG
jgi:hypothetical protein